MERDHAVNERPVNDLHGTGWRGARPGIALLIGIGAVLFLWRLGSHDLWPPDEPHLALVARSMSVRGDHPVPALQDSPRPVVPPLIFWAINAGAKLTGGVNEWSARLPSALSAIAALLLIMRLGTVLYDRRTGILGALVFATSVQTLLSGRWASIHMTLNLFILGAILLLHEGRTAQEGSPWRERLAWVLMGCATLTGGLTGLLIPLLAIIPSIVLERDLKSMRRLVLPSGWILYGLVVLAWLVPYTWTVGLQGTMALIDRPPIGLPLSGHDATGPIGYYLLRFPLGFLPWSLILPWAMVHVLGEQARRRQAVLLCTWVSALFLIFSLTPDKQGAHILPLYPAAALIVARLFSSASERKAQKGTGHGDSDIDRVVQGRLRTALFAWTCGASLLAAAVPIAIGREQPHILPFAIGVVALQLGGAVVASSLHARGRSGFAAGVMVASCVLILILAIEGIVPSVNRQRNIRGFAREVAGMLRPEIPFATTGSKRDAWSFYTERSSPLLDTPASVRDYLRGSGIRDLLIERPLLRSIHDGLPEGWVEILRGDVADTTYVLLRREGPP